jgi:hypothetical protein
MKFVLCLVGLFAMVVLCQSTAEAICLGPSLSVTATSAVPGGTMKVIGELFTDGCHDVIINGYRPPTLPAKNVRFFLVQGDRTVQIGAADADKDFKISVTLTIPVNTELGEATIFADAPGGAKTKPAAFRVIAKESEAPKESAPAQNR